MNNDKKPQIMAILEGKMRRLKEMGFEFGPILFDAKIVLVCGAFCLQVEKPGQTVGEFRSTHGKSLALLAGTIPWVNGKPVSEEVTLYSGDLLEFVLPERDLSIRSFSPN